MKASVKRKFYLVLTIGSVFGLPLTAFALLLLLNPYALLLSKSFSVHNQMKETILITPVGGVRYASGEHDWAVLPQLAVSFLSAPALRQSHIPVQPDQTVSIRANFDDISLGAIAVTTHDGQERVFVVDSNAAMGGCCYAPKNDKVVISEQDLVKGDRSMLDAIAEKDKRMDSLIRRWFVTVAIGLLLGFLFLFCLGRYLSLRDAHNG